MMLHLEILKSLRIDKVAVTEEQKKAKRNKASDEKLKTLQIYIDEIKECEEI